MLKRARRKSRRGPAGVISGSEYTSAWTNTPLAPPTPWPVTRLEPPRRRSVVIEDDDSEPNPPPRRRSVVIEDDDSEPDSPPQAQAKLPLKETLHRPVTALRGFYSSVAPPEPSSSPGVPSAGKVSVSLTQHTPTDPVRE